MTSKNRAIKAAKQKNLTTSVFQSLDTRTKYIALFSFIGLAFILYFQCLQFGYVLDDKIVITDNVLTKKGFAGLWDLLSTDSMHGFFGEKKDLLQGGRYRPLSIMTFAIEHQFWGLNSTISHHLNILIYGLSGYVCFLTLRRLFLENEHTNKVFFSLAFLSSIIFVLHPIHTEAVANIKGRDEIMAFIFSMLSLLFALKYFDQNKAMSIVGMICCYFLGLLSKENTITFLAIIPFSLLLFRTKDYRKLATIISLLFVITIVYLAIRYQVIGYLINKNPSTDIMNNPFYSISGSEKVATIFYTLIIYLKLCIFPHPLTHDYYPYHIPIMQMKDGIVWLSFLFHALMIFSVIFFWKRNRKIVFGAGFYLVAMTIISNIVFSVGTFMNERFAFASSLGFCILIVFGIQALTKTFFNQNKKILLTCMGIIVVGYGLKTTLRVPAWENALTLNREAIKISPNSARANSFMSTALFEQYKVTDDKNEKIRLLNEAHPYMRKALSIYPGYRSGNIMRAGIAAEKYKFDKNLDNLLNEFKEVIKVRPDVGFVTEYLNYLNNRADVKIMTQFYIESGELILSQKRNYQWAIHYLLMGNKISPDNQQIRSLLVQAYTLTGKTHEAQKYQ